MPTMFARSRPGGGLRCSAVLFASRTQILASHRKRTLTAHRWQLRGEQEEQQHHRPNGASSLHAESILPPA